MILYITSGFTYAPKHKYLIGLQACNLVRRREFGPLWSDPKLCLEDPKVPIIGIVILDNREGDEAVLVLEFGLFHHLMEQFCNLCRRVLECSATEGTENEGIVAIGQSDAENRPDLVPGNVDGRLGHMAVRSKLDRILSVQVQCSTCDHGHIIWILHQKAVDTLTKNGDSRGVDGTELRYDWIMLSRLQRISVSRGILCIERVDGSRQGAPAADGLLLCPGPGFDSTAGMPCACEIEKYWIVGSPAKFRV